MKLPNSRTPIALFVALTGAMREVVVRDDVRQHVYDALERMARAVGHQVFWLEFDALAELASEDDRIGAALEPFWNELAALGPQREPHAALPRIEDS